ncbi:MAG: hypothetical protein GC162_03195 [Planctomycetes bacterium]|nr:hypothetical protein [Planctomycetota bacterium]
MKAYPFVVADTPYCVWEWDLDDRNRQYLDRVDVDYFRYVAQAHGELLGGEHDRRAAISIRAAYFHGLETLFALLCATIQAPRCIPAWLQKYQNSELRDCVERIHSRGVPLHNRLGLPETTWVSIASKVIAAKYDNPVRTAETKSEFGSLWERFAHDFLDPIQIAEYNSIKHGFRVGSGGFAIAVGIEENPGIACSQDKMQLIGGSSYGTSFYQAEPPSGSTLPKRDPNFRIKSHGLNWHPLSLAARLDLIGMSIKNVIAFLKIINGTAPERVEFVRPIDTTSFVQPWDHSVGVTSCTMDTVVGINDIRPMTGPEIMTSYGTTHADD